MAIDWKKIHVDGITYLIQSYKKNQRANLCPRIDSYCYSSVVIDLEAKKINGTWGKEDKNWKELTSKIDVPKLIKELDSYFETQKQLLLFN